MTIQIIKNKEDNIKNKIFEMLSKKSLYKLIILGTIDDYIFTWLNNIKISSEYSQYISIDKKYTTYKMLEDLLKTDNTYIYNNNLHKQTKKENIIFVDNDDEIEMLISSFEFTKENLDNSDSNVMYIRGNKASEELSEIVKLYNYYKNNLGEYSKLTKELLNELDKNKDFRNSKINTIFEEMQIDEVISSFRHKENAYKTLYKEDETPIIEDIEIEINID